MARGRPPDLVVSLQPCQDWRKWIQTTDFYLLRINSDHTMEGGEEGPRPSFGNFQKTDGSF